MAKRRNPYRFPRQTLAKLEERIARCKLKIADPNDPDDKKWLGQWLAAAERRVAKKVRSLESKDRRR